MLHLRKLRLFVAFFTVLSMCGFQERSELIVAPRYLACLKMLFMDNVVTDEGILFVSDPSCAPILPVVGKESQG